MKYGVMMLSLVCSLFCKAMQLPSDGNFCDNLCRAIKDDNQSGVEALFNQPKSAWNIEYLLKEQKLDPNMQSAKNLTSRGHALIHWATRANNRDVLEVLLGDQRTIVDIENANGCTALGFAVARGKAEATDLLLHHGANPNAISNKDFYPKSNARYALLHSAIMNYRQLSPQNDYYKVIGLLLSNERTDPNIQDAEGKTPLHHAVMWRCAKVVELLLSNSKINKNILDKKCNTPLDYAREVEDEVIEQLLLNHNK